SPDTNLHDFFEQLSTFSSLVAPAAETNASLFSNLDTTMTALSEVAKPYIQDSISGGKPALDEAIKDFPQQRPFIANTTGLMHDLHPGIAALRTAAPPLNDALRVGAKVLPKTPPLNKRLDDLLQEVKTFSQDPMVPRGITSTTDAVTALKTPLDFLAPAQTQCNYVTLFFPNMSSVPSEGDRNGTWQRFIIVTTPQGPNGEGGPSSAPANGPTTDNHLHTNPYPNTASPGQDPKECEAGNETYVAGKTII